MLDSGNENPDPEAEYNQNLVEVEAARRKLREAKRRQSKVREEVDRAQKAFNVAWRKHCSLEREIQNMNNGNES